MSRTRLIVGEAKKMPSKRGKRIKVAKIRRAESRGYIQSCACFELARGVEGQMAEGQIPQRPRSGGRSSQIRDSGEKSRAACDRTQQQQQHQHILCEKSGRGVKPRGPQGLGLDVSISQGQGRTHQSGYAGRAQRSIK